MTRLIVALACLLCLACGDDQSPTIDASSQSTDASGTVIDAGTATVDATSTGADAMPGSADAMASSFGPVDCVTNADCTSPTTCTQTAPGGICNGCGNESQCDSGFTCVVGACVRDCQDDSECSAGKRCTPGTGRCVLRSCASTPCPAPYTCGNTNFCQRPTCGLGNSCTLGFTCDVPSQICMEPIVN